MPGYPLMMRRLLPPVLVLGGIGAYKMHRHQQQQKYQQLAGAATRIKEPDGSKKNTIATRGLDEQRALALTLFAQISMQHQNEVKTILHSMRNISDPEGTRQFQYLNLESLASIAAKLESGENLYFPEFMLYCQMLPAYRNAGLCSQTLLPNGEWSPAFMYPLYEELRFEEFISHELEAQYPGLNTNKLVSDFEEKKVAFHKVFPNHAFMLTTREALMTPIQYNFHIATIDPKSKQGQKLVDMDDIEQAIKNAGL